MGGRCKAVQPWWPLSFGSAPLAGAQDGQARRVLKRAGAGPTQVLFGGADFAADDAAAGHGFAGGLPAGDAAGSHGTAGPLSADAFRPELQVQANGLHDAGSSGGHVDRERHEYGVLDQRRLGVRLLEKIARAPARERSVADRLLGFRILAAPRAQD